VKSGVVSAISSHHQPHERDAKLAPFGATEPGISSVELLLPLAMTLVEDGLLDLPTLLARLRRSCRSVALPAGKLAVGGPADIVLFDPAASTVAGETWLSKGENCPFIGHSLPGVVRYTLVDGGSVTRRKTRCSNRGQARSHRVIGWPQDLRTTHPLWERACPR